MSDSFSFSRLRSALIVGAGHGIGFALVQRIRALAPRALVFATYRRADFAGPLLDLASGDSLVSTFLVDPLMEDAFSCVRLHSAFSGSLDLLINAVGTLHDESDRPERSLDALNLAQLHRTFAVNAFVTPLLARWAKPLLARDQPTAFAALSAKVGSISDNKLGGWYSYRASKSALNMFIKTIALEFGRSGLPKCSVLAIHPGTTDTTLSRPFQRGVKHQIWSPAESAEHILDTIVSASAEGTGLFKNWDGTTLSW